MKFHVRDKFSCPFKFRFNLSSLLERRNNYERTEIRMALFFLFPVFSFSFFVNVPWELIKYMRLLRRASYFLIKRFFCQIRFIFIVSRFCSDTTK